MDRKEARKTVSQALAELLGDTPPTVARTAEILRDFYMHGYSGGRSEVFTALAEAKEVALAMGHNIRRWTLFPEDRVECICITREERAKSRVITAGDVVQRRKRCPAKDHKPGALG